MNDLVLMESRSFRDENISRVEVLEKVKAIEYLTKDFIVSVEQAADYYEVPKGTIDSLISENRNEISADGLKTLRGNDLKTFKANLGNPSTLKYASHFTIIPRRALLRIGMLLRDSEVAAEVRTMLLDKEEDSNFVELEKELLATKYATDILGVCQSSKILMLERVYENNNIPTNSLPAYADESHTRSLTYLLKQHNIKMGASKVNLLLEIEGFLSKEERRSRKTLTGTKEFWKLTEKGLEYGKNLINSHNHLETQPHYYEDTFIELMENIGLS